MRQKWYNDCVVRATERPYRSGTGGVIVAHPAIVQTALHNIKHDVQMKYWSYFGMFYKFGHGHDDPSHCLALEGTLAFAKMDLDEYKAWKAEQR